MNVICTFFSKAENVYNNSEKVAKKVVDIIRILFFFF